MAPQDPSPSASPSGAEASADFDFRLYRYTPSLAAAIAALVVFAVLTGIHAWRMTRARAFYFTAFTIGGCCMWCSVISLPSPDRLSPHWHHTPDACHRRPSYKPAH